MLGSLAGSTFFVFVEGVRWFLCQLPVDATGETVSAGEAMQSGMAAQVIFHVHQPQEQLPILLRQPGREFFVGPVDLIVQVLN